MHDETNTKKEGRSTEHIIHNKHTDTKNSVTLGQIWKEDIFYEKLFARHWPKKYGCLKGDLFEKILAEECRKAGLPEETFQYKPSEDVIKHSPTSLKPSSNIPKTSSGMIGLQSSRLENNHEFTRSMYISPKLTIEPPKEPGKFYITEERFIFLG